MLNNRPAPAPADLAHDQYQGLEFDDRGRLLPVTAVNVLQYDFHCFLFCIFLVGEHKYIPTTCLPTPPLGSI